MSSSPDSTPDTRTDLLNATDAHVEACLGLTRALSGIRTDDEIYEVALDALADGLGVRRASILLFDADGVMRFKAHRQLSDAYRRAVEGHSPWTPDSQDADAIFVEDVAGEPSLAPYIDVITAEGISAMAFIPLVSLGRVIGKFMLYADVPRTFTPAEARLADIIACHVAFAVERTRSEALARRGETRLRFALDSASMGTWDWDLATQSVEWSDNLEAVHGLPPGTFDGTFASYEREIHPEDRERVHASIERAIAEGVPHEVEYRLVAPDGTIRWAEGKGHVEFEDGRPVRMSGVCMMITRRKEAELARLAAAEEAARLTDEFLATLSHELRTPLNAILGWAQMLQTRALPPDRLQQAVDVIGRNARLQAQLIEDILDLSRIITGKLQVERLPVSISQLVEAAINGVQPAAEAKALTVSRRLDPALPVLEGDPSRLQQVLGNVLANAIKFTPEGGRVELRATVDDGEISIDVSDSGVGIAVEFLPYVFDRFRQEDSRTTRRHGGLGLGLAIARHLVEEHGGEIQAHSEGLGRGTTIRIRLPAGAPPPVTAASDGPSSLDLDPRLTGATVVIVDDQADSRELLAAVFEEHGAHVVTCDSALGALDAVTAGLAQLLVADIAMPVVDGYELIRRVRSRANGIPAIAVSAYARPEDRALALATGFDAYCVKPIDEALFLRAVGDALQAAAQRGDP